MKESAGILLYRLADGGPEVLLVHPGGPFWTKKDLGAWSIPKGEPDEGEELLGAALRELKEELGTPPELLAGELVDLGSVRQKAKIVHGWAAEADFDPATLRCIAFEMEWPPRSGIVRSSPRSIGPSGSTRDGEGEADPGPGRFRRSPARALGIGDRLL